MSISVEKNKGYMNFKSKRVPSLFPNRKFNLPFVEVYLRDYLDCHWCHLN